MLEYWNIGKDASPSPIIPLFQYSMNSGHWVVGEACLAVSGSEDDKPRPSYSNFGDRVE